MLIRNARLVAVRTPAPTEEPVDIRIDGGAVVQVAAGLSARIDEHVLDADGRWTIPGLWDSHVHMQLLSLSRQMLDVSGAADADAVVREVARHIAQLPATTPDSVVHGYGHRSATWPRQPTVAELDAVSGAHPVILTSGDAHNGWLNSAALQLLGLPKRTDPLAELEWFALTPRIDALQMDERALDAAYRAAVAAAASLGVVGIVDFDFGKTWVDWPRRVSTGIDLLRVRPATYPDTLDEVIAGGLRTGAVLSAESELVRMGPLKIISDGSLNTRTAYCEDPFLDATDLDEPYGRANYPPDELDRLLVRAREHGLTVAVHAIGDAAVRVALDSFAATGIRGSVEHAQLMRRADIGRMARLGVRASVQPAHLLDDRDVTARCWPDRADRCFPLRSLLDAGVVLTLGSDAPVAPLDPWLAMAAAVHRSGDEREAWNPAESITVAQALAASTDGQPTLAPGSRGDLVLLDANPLDTGPATRDAAEHLRTMQVAATIVAGRVTFDRGVHVA